MDIIEAGKICRDAGFNWGRGSWWTTEDLRKSWIVEIDRLIKRDLRDCIPNLTKDATRGVILGWAREMTGDETLNVQAHYLSIVDNVIWDVCSLVSGFCEFDAETEIECYAKLCQWVQENKR